MRKTILPTLLFLLPLCAVSAQVCPGLDDGLYTGGCCDIVRADYPNFPDWNSDALWVGLRGCDVDCQARAEFKMTEPRRIDCDRATLVAKWAVDFGTYQVVWEGTLNAKYGRTFKQRSTTSGRLYQVWRFIVNGDFVPETTAHVLDPCAIPPCYSIFRAVHFTGHIDYACNGHGGYDVAVSLQHLPGCISHGGVSSRPLSPLTRASHYERNYYMIAPGRFLVGANQGREPQGRLMGEDFRTSDLRRGVCYSENYIGPEPILSVFRDCPCVGGGGNIPWFVQETALVGQCGGRSTIWKPIALGPVVPDGINLQTVGRWALGGTDQYPEDQTLIHYQAFVVTEDPVLCLSNTYEPKQFLTGVGTKGNRTWGYHPSIFTPVDNAIDLVNHVDPLSFGFGWGAPSTADLHFGLFVN